MTTPTHIHARQHERIRTVIPVRLSGQTGFTRDISIGGCYLQLEEAATPENEGRDVCFDLDPGVTHGAMKIRCCGQIVRRDRDGPLTGMAIKIKDLQLLVKEIPDSCTK
ncbi:PilZ domain-containing protein [Aeromonas sanarellii]|uniref:PilZ domain-containing protein n=1 Tax=Aeromonas sanarellii TaxID=633415 RepID=UPI0038D25A0F